MNSLLKKPSAWIPIAMSFASLALILGNIAIFGITYEEDEGAAAHIFQIWMVLEILSIGFFTIKWIPQRPKQALFVLFLQFLAMLGAMFPIFYFER